MEKPTLHVNTLLQLFAEQHFTLLEAVESHESVQLPTGADCNDVSSLKSHIYIST